MQRYADPDDDYSSYERETTSDRDYPGQRGRRDFGYAREPYRPGGEGRYGAGYREHESYDADYEPERGAYRDYGSAARRGPYGDEGSYGHAGRYGQGGTAQAGYGRLSGQGYGATAYECAPARTSEGQHVGRGPKNYQRSAERTTEEVCERLTWSGYVDASNIEVHVEGDEVTLEGTVDSRQAKRTAEDLAESAPGVRDVHNRLRIRQESSGATPSAEQQRSGKRS